MLQTVLTLIRGACADQEEVLQATAALPLLRQQIREAASALDTARQDLAAAMAGLKEEQRVLDGINAQIERLSTAAQKALRDDREDLARPAAVQIAALEDERAERAASLQQREAWVQEQRAIVTQGRTRLRRLGEGYRFARVDASLRQAGLSGRTGVTSSTGKLATAEATLARLKERTRRDADFDEALQSLHDADDAATALADAGYGPALKTDPNAVLARLKAQAGSPATPKTPGDHQ
ncbi:PspA/IM30 family protein [Microvirga arabica]|uniref:PspA/IM30 family protein n=1 Tax=Microvirga arabica TaxID=1128671 RepID=UPI00193A567D|nr:PspA/IM30 family protein [Microvirga arabica]MBM1172044.1 PspA/IM30 family protein [Microvirga arabica]